MLYILTKKNTKNKQQHLKTKTPLFKYKKMVDTSALTSTANPYEVVAELLGVSVGTALIILTIISIWALVWKGIALWKSSKKNHLVWFIALLIINTMGILEILYIYIFSKISLKGKSKNSPKKKKK